MSGSLARAASRASSEATASRFIGLSLPSHRDGSIDVGGRDSYGPTTSDPEERTHSSRVAQPAAGLSSDPQEGPLGSQGLTTLGLVDATPTASGCTLTPTVHATLVRTASLTGCGEHITADWQLCTEPGYAHGMEVVANPTGGSTDYPSYPVNQPIGTTHAASDYADGMADASTHARRPSYFTLNGRDGGTGKEPGGTMQMVEFKAEGIIPTLTSTLHPKPILTIDSSGAPNSIPKFVDLTNNMICMQIPIHYLHTLSVEFLDYFWVIAVQKLPLEFILRPK